MMIFPIYIYGKIKNVPNHQPVLCKAPKILDDLGVNAADLPINSGIKGFLYPNSWMVSNGKSENKMDDLGVPSWIGKLHIYTCRACIQYNYLCAEDKRLAQELSAIPKKTCGMRHPLTGD